MHYSFPLVNQSMMMLNHSTKQNLSVTQWGMEFFGVV